MSRRAFNLAEFANAIQFSIGVIKERIEDAQKELRKLEITVQVAAKMAEPKSKKKEEENGTGN